MTTTDQVIRPNPGPQEMFLATTAYIAIYGGFPGGGKSFGLNMEGGRHFQNPNYYGVIIRRIREDLTKTGGIWDAAKKFFSQFKARINNSDLSVNFPAGGILAYGSMADARTDHERYKSTEFDFIGFEEIAADNPKSGIEEHQFWYMISRNRGKARSGITSYVRGTSNPAPGWLARLLIQAGYVNKDGYAIESMSGVIRWFYRDEDTNILAWFDSEEECQADIEDKGFEDIGPMSFTFILAKPEDNPYQDKDYLSKLSNLGRVERERLKKGNWLIESDDSGLFKRSWWCKSTKAPKASFFKELVRSWDIAATEKTDKKEPAYTASVLMGRTQDDRYWILEAERFRATPAKLKQNMLTTANRDREKYGRVITTIPMDPAAAGRISYESLATNLAGFPVKPMPTIGDKAARAEGLADAAENSFVTLVIDEYDSDDTMEALISEGATFPFGSFKDLIDAASDAYDYLTQRLRQPKKSFKKRRMR